MTLTRLQLKGALDLITGRYPIDCDEDDACSCRQCRVSEAVRPTITERLMRWRVEPITEPLIFKHITATELWKVYEWGRPAHFVAVGYGRLACTTLHDRDRPVTTDADCAEAVLAVKAYRLGESLTED